MLCLWKNFCYAKLKPISVSSQHSKRKVPFKMDKSILKPSVRFQNTYQMDSENPFNSTMVQIIMDKVLEKRFKDVEQIDNHTTAILCRSVSDDVIEKVKTCNFDRWKEFDKTNTNRIKNESLQVQNHCNCFRHRKVCSSHQLLSQTPVGYQ